MMETTAELSDLAESILCQIAALQWPALWQRMGVPYLAEGPRAQQQTRFVLLGLGKLGGRELSYHSDLDLLLVYEGDGRTGPPPGVCRFEQFDLTDNFHFFTEYTQRLIKAVSVLGPMGRLYQVDMRLRPTGKSGSLVLPLTRFRRYYEEGGAQLWERQMLTRARVVYGDPEFGCEVMQAVTEQAFGIRWQSALAEQIADMRERLESSRSERDVKRGFGGMVDIEFLVQLLQLKYGQGRPEIRRSNTWEALTGVYRAGLLSPPEFEALTASYNFLRQVESRLRIVHNRSLDELPQAAEDLEILARRLGFEAKKPGTAGQEFLGALERHTTQTRRLFRKVVQREGKGDETT
jgi:glutamate-ammonia-ligase adenylyltransferase